MYLRRNYEVHEYGIGFKVKQIGTVLVTKFELEIVGILSDDKIVKYLWRYIFKCFFINEDFQIDILLGHVNVGST